MREEPANGAGDAIDEDEPIPACDLPADVVEETARLTRLARRAAERTDAVGPFEDAAADLADEADAIRARRDDLLRPFGYVARVRDDRDGGATLVCYPASWLDDDGVVRLDADLHLDRAVEVSLSGPGEQGDFEEAAAANDDLVADVRAEHGDPHATNVRAFADFMSNHYARPATTASAAEVREFFEEFYPRNAWPTDEQAAVVERSLRLAFACRQESFPLD